MVGQTKLLKYTEEMVRNDKFPRFSIFVGERGSEKNDFAPYIAGYMCADYIRACDVKIDTIRELIEQSYKVRGITVISIPDADTMSVPAKNALLKITEEPPNNAYIIMTLEDVNNTLDTIKSRASIFRLEQYKRYEIYEYAQKVLKDDGKARLAASICSTPGEVDLFREELGGERIVCLFDYVNLVIEHIEEASPANALKISEKVNLKNEPEQGKYDLKMFWKAFMVLCGEHILDSSHYIEWARITSKTLTKLCRIKGINKQMLFDGWVFDIREWR